MCGINGVLGDHKDIVQSMNTILKHRGPDQSGVFSDSSVTLGSVRLAIIDLSKKARMPMHNDKQTLWIVYNGEVYNFKELRAILERRGHTFNSKSDTEVILKSYEEWGQECVNHLNGEFAFCIYDRRKKQLFLARDRLGIKPLFYRYKKGKSPSFAFSSELKGLLVHPEVDRDINWNSMGTYLTFRYIPGEETIIKGIKKLLPGHTLLLDLKSRKMSGRRYWRAEFQTEHLGERDAAARLLDLLKDSVHRRMISDVPLGAFLSGGIDSTALVALMAKLSENPIKTYSVGFDEASFSEVESSRLVAEELGTDHTELTVSLDSTRLLPHVIWHLDDLMADPAALPTYAMCEATRKHVTVALSGDGNDELLAGYIQYRLLKKGHVAHNLLPRTVRTGLMNLARAIPPIPYSERMKALILSEDDDERFLAAMASFTSHEKRMLLTSKGKKRLQGKVKENLSPYLKTNLPPLHRWLHFDIENWLPYDILVKSDRMSMAHSLELRVPYLDHRYVEFTMKLAPHMRLRRGNEKILFKRAVKGLVPPEIVKRKKQGFALPINEWLESGLQDQAQEIFRTSKILNSGYFKRQALHRIMKQHHLSRKVYKRHFWSLLTLALWHKTHIERKTTSKDKIGTLEEFI